MNSHQYPAMRVQAHRAALMHDIETRARELADIDSAKKGYEALLSAAAPVVFSHGDRIPWFDDNGDFVFRVVVSTDYAVITLRSEEKSSVVTYAISTLIKNEPLNATSLRIEAEKKLKEMALK